jgi:hypothetical protein
MQDPVNVESRYPDAKVAARVGLDRRELFAMAEEREEPAPRPRLREVPEQRAVRVLHVHGGERHRILDAGHRILLDDLAANPPEEKELRVDLPFELVRELGDRQTGKLLRLEFGERAEPGGLRLRQLAAIGCELFPRAWFSHASPPAKRSRG